MNMKETYESRKSKFWKKKNIFSSLKVDFAKLDLLSLVEPKYWYARECLREHYSNNTIGLQDWKENFSWKTSDRNKFSPFDKKTFSSFFLDFAR